MGRGRPAKYNSNAERQAEYRDRKRRTEALQIATENARREEWRIRQNQDRAAQEMCLSMLLDAFQKDQKKWRAAGIYPAHEFDWQQIEGWLDAVLRDRKTNEPAKAVRQMQIEDVHPEDEWPTIS